MKKHYFLVILLLVAFFACGKQNDNTDNLFLQVETLTEEYPDSALQILESLPYPKRLGKEQYNKYNLLLVQAKDKSYKEIGDDTMIFDAKRYYLKEKDFDNAALAAYYCGRVLHGKDHVKAMVEYTNAEDYAKHSDNFNLKGLIEANIGGLYAEQSLSDEAIKRMKLSCAYFVQAKNYKNEATEYCRIGNVFHQKGLYSRQENELDSASYYYNKGMSVAELHNDSIRLAITKQNLAVFLMNKGDKALSREYSRQAIPCFKNPEDQAKAYLNMAASFVPERQRDSVFFYLDKTLELLKGKKSSAIKGFNYKILSRLEENDENYKEALAYYKKYTDTLLYEVHNSMTEKISVAQKKYNFELIENENNRLTIEKQSSILIGSTLLTIALVIIAFFYWKMARNKKDLYEAQQTIYHMKEMALAVNQKENSVKSILYQHFDILKKLALLDGYLRDDEKTPQGQKLLKKVNKIVYMQESIDWNVLYESMNQLHNGFFDTLRSTYPQLDESEFRICSLTYADLNNTEIGIIMGLSVNTIQMKKSNIRKKIGIEHHGNIVEFLDEKINRGKTKPI